MKTCLPFSEYDPAIHNLISGHQTLEECMLHCQDCGSPPAQNYANYNRAADWDGQNGNATTAGSNGGPSHYGTLDMSGNVYEWTETTNGEAKNVRGGCWGNLSQNRLSSDFSFNFKPNRRARQVGFRVAGEQTTELALVGNPGNEPDANQRGTVGRTYKIAAKPVTNEQYARFLNAVAYQDTHGLYQDAMSGPRSGITRSQSGQGYTYSTKENYQNKPVVWVNWFDCARYCNWLANGTPTGTQSPSTTEDGTYTLNGTPTTRNATNPNTGNPPLYYIPTENEWYKAAYHSPNKNGTGPGYWKYATQSDTQPTPATANSLGDGPFPY